MQAKDWTLTYLHTTHALSVQNHPSMATVLSILVGAQTKGQFHLLYGTEGTQGLCTGLAPQIVYGVCDHDTPDFYSKASATTTADVDPKPGKANFRQGALLTVDDVVTPQVGNCTVFARYVEPAFAT